MLASSEDEGDASPASTRSGTDTPPAGGSAGAPAPSSHAREPAPMGGEVFRTHFGMVTLLAQAARRLAAGGDYTYLALSQDGEALCEDASQLIQFLGEGFDGHVRMRIGLMVYELLTPVEGTAHHGFAHLHDLVQSVVGMTNEELFDW